MKTWLLVVYLFLPSGEAIVNKYENAADSYETCRTLGWQKAKELYEQRGQGTYSFMCIDKAYKP